MATPTPSTPVPGKPAHRVLHHLRRATGTHGALADQAHEAAHQHRAVRAAATADGGVNTAAPPQ
jgi:hypothetical protein